MPAREAAASTPATDPTGEWTHESGTMVIDGETVKITYYRNTRTAQIRDVTEIRKPIESDEPTDAEFRWEKGTPAHIKARDLSRAGYNCANNAAFLKARDPGLSEHYTALATRWAGHARHMTGGTRTPIRTAARSRTTAPRRATRRLSANSSTTASGESSDPPPSQAPGSRRRLDEDVVTPQDGLERVGRIVWREFAAICARAGGLS